MTWPADKPLPAVLTDRDLRELLNYGHSQYFKRKARGDFRAFEVKPQLPNSHTQYSGKKVQDWLDGKESRFFQAHLRAVRGR